MFMLCTRVSAELPDGGRAPKSTRSRRSIGAGCRSAAP